MSNNKTKKLPTNSSKICRFCLANDSETIDLFDELAINMNCIEIISNHFWFTPSANDKFSKLMCTDCWTKIESFHTFYISVKSTESQLLNEQPPSISSNNEHEVKNENFPIKFDHVDTFVTDTEVKIELDDNLLINHEDNNVINTDHSWADDIDIEPKQTKRKPIKRKAKIKGTSRKRETVIAVKKQKKSSKKDQDIIAEDYNDLYDEDIKLAESSEQYRKDDERIREFFNLKCEKCTDNQLFKSLREIRTHFRDKHSTSRGYIKCCKRKFFRRSILLEHLSWHLNPEAFRCPVCKKLYTSSAGIQMHMPTHATEAEKIFCCDICGKRFAKKFALSHHLRLTHISEAMKTHKCSQCDKAFAARSLLDYHIRGVHEFAYQNICEICAKVFKSKHQCEHHRRIEHSDSTTRPKYQCTQCGACLKTEFGLTRHMRSMHIEKPVSCTICGKITPNKGALRSHVRYMHEIERSFHCKLCEKSFKRDKALQEHMASHTGSILYNCQYCTKTFNSNANMHSHRKKMHPVEWLRDRRSKTSLSDKNLNLNTE